MEATEVNDTREVTVEIQGMTCDHCERAVANALRSVPGVAEVLSVSSASGLARIAAAPEATAERIQGAVSKAGYRARVPEARTGAGPAGVARADAAFYLVIVGGGSPRF